MKVRPLETHEEKERKERTRKMIGGIVLIGIMVLSSIGFAFFLGGGILSGSGQAEQGVDDEIYYNGQYWVVQKEGAKAFLSVHPDELMNSPVGVSIEKRAHDYRGASVFIDSESREMTGLISANLAQYASSIKEACYGKCTRDLPEKTCDENMIIWRASENERVFQEGNCVFIEGSTIAANSFIYDLFYRR